MTLRSLLSVVCLLTAISSHVTVARAQTATAELSPALTAQAQAAAQGKFGFFVFYRDDSDAARAMAQVVADLAVQRPETVAPIHVQVTNPAEAATVRQFNVERAPMPLVIVTAPNGAITGAYPQRVTSEQLAGSFVTPAMSHCMKSMQQGRWVFLCVQTSSQAALPQGVSEFLADPQFKGRGDVVTVQAADPAEAQLLQELAVNTADPNGTRTVFFAPPGVLVGKFASHSSKSEIAAALHKAGKCCEDPNCKHGRAQQSQPNTTR